MYLTRLLDHMGWADRLALEALRDASRIDSAPLKLLAHVLGAEHLWYCRLRGVPAELPVWPKLSPDDCERVARENLERFTSFVAGLSPADLGRGITYKNSAGAEFTSTVEDILLHVCLHGTYHRGQIAWAIRHAGDVPKPTDYIAFIRGSPAATRTASG